jgi:hypothetical protein
VLTFSGIATMTTFASYRTNGGHRYLLRELDPASKWTVQSFLLKLATVVIFAGFVVKRPALEGVLVLSGVNALLSVTMAIFYRDRCNDGPLNNWDEAMAFAALCALAYVLRIVIGWA